MEVWITRQEEKHRRYLPGILLESFLIFLVNGVGTFALLHTLVPSVNGIPFLVSVTVTALLCAVLFRLREHLVAAVFSLSAAAGICLFAFSGMLLNGFLSLWKGKFLITSPMHTEKTFIHVPIWQNSHMPQKFPVNRYSLSM